MNAILSTVRSGNHHAVRPNAERGIALVVAMILLVIATLTGIAGIRNTTLQERMTGNLYDRSLAFQAAESAMRYVQLELSNESNIGVLGGVNCRLPGANCPVIPANTFDPADNSNWQAIPTSALTNESLRVGLTPEYLIQWVGENDVNDQFGLARSANCLQYGLSCPISTADIYRVTVRSGQPTVDNDRAIVVLSGVFSRPR